MKEIFRKFLASDVSPWLRARGFSRKGQTFHKWIQTNCQVINFQTSMFSEPKSYEFTVNVGVFFGEVYRFRENIDQVPRVPPLYSYHWDMRLGALMPQNRDIWWPIESEEDVPPISREIKSALQDYALPALDRFTDEKTLPETLLAGKLTKRNRAQQLLYLAIMYRERYTRQELLTLIAELRAEVDRTPRIAREYFDPSIAKLEAEVSRTRSTVN